MPTDSPRDVRRPEVDPLGETAAFDEVAKVEGRAPPAKDPGRGAEPTPSATLGSGHDTDDTIAPRWTGAPPPVGEALRQQPVGRGPRRL